MGRYGELKCPVCKTTIATTDFIENCPSCKEYIGDKFHLQGQGTGITKLGSMNTARTIG